MTTLFVDSRGFDPRTPPFWTFAKPRGWPKPTLVRIISIRDMPESAIWDEKTQRFVFGQEYIMKYGDL